MYEFRCEIYQPEDEVIDLPDGLTDVNGEDIDEQIITAGQVITLVMESEKTQNAEATVSLASTITGVKSVQYIKLFDDGNYLGTPTVTVHKPSGGNGASGTCTIAEGGISSVSITNSGSNYLKVPTVSFSPPNKPTSSQIKFGNNSLYHSSITDVDLSLIHISEPTRPY